jgi:hypothetical protein
MTIPSSIPDRVADLFDLDRALTPAERRRLRGSRPPKGYAAPPGSGPAGETCKSCQHLVRREKARTYLKCGLMERGWTGGAGTDVRASSPACSRWEAGAVEVAAPKPARAKAKAPKVLPPPTMRERADAAIAARALRAAWPHPVAMGDAQTTHIDFSRPRRGVWITRWNNVPGLAQVNGAYQHDLLPGWQYTRAEVEAEMIPDLELLAERGIRPTEATNGAAA